MEQHKHPYCNGRYSVWVGYLYKKRRTSCIVGGSSFLAYAAEVAIDFFFVSRILRFTNEDTGFSKMI